AKEPRLVTARQFLRNTYWNRAQALSLLGRHAEAVAEWEQTLALNEEEPAAGWLRLQRSASLARAGEYGQATAAVEGGLKPENAASDMLYVAAGVYAQAAAQAGKQAPGGAGRAHAEKYARRAVALLREAVRKGYKNVAQIQKDSDLNALRGRPDFQQVLTQLA